MGTLRLTLRGVSPSIWSHPLTSEAKVIGRRSECTIQLLHKSVSRKHAEVSLSGNEVGLLNDLGSSNGTCVNGNRVTGSSSLKAGDVVQLGQVVLDVVSDDGESRGPTTDSMLNRTTELGNDLFAVDDTPPPDSTANELSEAQLRVLRPLLSGQSEKEIAAELFLSPHTVHSHVKQIYQHYNVNSRPALMAHFIDIASLPDPE